MQSWPVTLWALVVGACTTADKPFITAQTMTGVVRGAHDSLSGVTAFLGMPYAVPPVDSLRWRAPLPRPPWPDTLEATTHGAACPQPPSLVAFQRGVARALGGDTLRVAPLAPTDEDCLFLNVWTAAAPAPAPVLVWVHGGGGFVGSGSEPMFDGARLARRGAVVVTLNYRLGPLGFFAHPALSEESRDGGAGNYALWDLLAALRWVRDNVAAFGGDPQRVTLFGQSAGATLIGFLLAMPAADGLFHRAILQSGTGFEVGMPLRAPTGEPSGESVGARLVDALGLPNDADLLVRLRSFDAQQLLRAAFTNRAAPNAPVIDGRLVPKAPHEVFDAGQQHPVPVIVGSNEDETTVLGGFGGPPLTTLDAWHARLRADFGDDAPALIAAYDTIAGRDVRAAQLALANDAGFHAPVARLAAALAARGQPVYVYRFAAAAPGDSGASLGAFHSAELPYVFGNEVAGWWAMRERERRISEQMMSYWVRFAATGDPNVEGQPAWPRYDPRSPVLLRIGDSTRAVAAPQGAAFDALVRRVRP